MTSRNKSYFQKLPMKGISLFLFTFTFTFIANVTDVAAQRGLISERFVKIIPGISTRKDVEKLFPIIKAAKYANEHTIDFFEKDLAIGVAYSTGKCGDSLMYDWKFQEWTVVGVSYDWVGDKQIPLTDVILDLSKFERKQISDVIVHVNYINEEWGIDVVYDVKRRSVNGIDLTPAAKLKKKYECP